MQHLPSAFIFCLPHSAYCLLLPHRPIIQQMSYRLIEKQVLFSGSKIRLELHHLENEEGQRTRREVCVHPGAVVILPLLPDGRIVLIRNRRYAWVGSFSPNCPREPLKE